MPNLSALTPGHHHFTSPTKHLTFEYIIIIHNNNSHSQPTPPNPLLIHCPAWGLGSTYLQAGLQAGLQALETPSRPLLIFHPRGTDGTSFPSSPNEMATTPHLASDLEDLRLYLGLDSFPALLGHSQGGAVVLAYAQMYPKRVENLVLVNHSLPGMTDRRVLMDESALEKDERFADAVKVLKTAEPRTDEEFTDMVYRIWPVYFFDPVSFVGVLRVAVGGRVMPINCWRSVYGCDRALRDGRIVEGLERVTARTLIISGKNDLICGPRIAEVTDNGIRDTVVLRYERCGHFPWIERREDTLRDIDAFLEGG